jgi:hypothetical protein
MRAHVAVLLIAAVVVGLLWCAIVLALVRKP